jgi:hypothetical protein
MKKERKEKEKPSKKKKGFLAGAVSGKLEE